MHIITQVNSNSLSFFNNELYEESSWYIFAKQVDTDHRHVGNSVEVKLYSDDDAKDEEKPILIFTMNKGEKYLIFENAVGMIFAEEKRNISTTGKQLAIKVSIHTKT